MVLNLITGRIIFAKTNFPNVQAQHYEIKELLLTLKNTALQNAKDMQQAGVPCKSLSEWIEEQRRKLMFPFRWFWMDFLCAYII